MEITMMGSSNLKVLKGDEVIKELGFCNNMKNVELVGKSRICLVESNSLRKNENDGWKIKAVHTGGGVTPVERKLCGGTLTTSSSNSIDGVRLFVGLPLDVVSACNTVNHERAITAGLKALKLMGVDGVELPVWWGIVENDDMGKYNWYAYLAVAELVQKIGLKLHVSLCFHASQHPRISLPEWVSRVGEANPSIYFCDRSGRQYKDCLSLAVDDLPVLSGKSPIQVYQDFCESFKSEFSFFMGSTITGVTVGLGPDGELRYPSSDYTAKTSNHSGVGEFQCYDKYMLSNLKQHAEATGNPLWGLGGPHDVPTYDEPPSVTSFFKDEGGSWEMPYGDFFLSWYSSQLISHGNRILSLASTVFCGTPIALSGKLPLLHSWYRTRSHPSELTAGFYNTANGDGYERVAEMFAENSCSMILPGMDLSNKHQPLESSPQALLAQIKGSCRRYGVLVSGQNLSISGGSEGFEEIHRNLSDDSDVLKSFMYQRMGADFFSPKHFPLFTAFVRTLSQPDMDIDDMPDAKEVVEPVHVSSEAGLCLHAQAV